MGYYHRHGSRIALAICLLAGAVALAACGVRPASQPSREERFWEGLRQGNYQQAQDQLKEPWRARWRQDTEALVRQHGGLHIPVWSGGRNGFPPIIDQRDSLYRIAFADGYERCLWVRRGSNGLLELVHGGYVDCATIPTPSVYGTPGTPGRPGAPPTP